MLISAQLQMEDNTDHAMLLRLQGAVKALKQLLNPHPVEPPPDDQ